MNVDPHFKIMVNEVKTFLLMQQKEICLYLENLDQTKRFEHDSWDYQPGSGGGISSVLTNGKVFDSAGVNFSHIYGEQLPTAATVERPELADRHFQAMGISIVCHPVNPFIPTTHANFRLFIAEKDGEPPVWWFGGGFDLTPYYPFKEDCIYWHQMAKAASDPFGSKVYTQHKKQCDDYFYLPHRQEARGIGGIFYDDLNCWDFNTCFAHMQSVAKHFIEAYTTIVERRKEIAYQPKHKSFQLYRRGRYVEFNLLYDRGTKFGLQSNGRTESILMSLPPQVSWRYNWQPEPGTQEEQLSSYYLKARDWLQTEPSVSDREKQAVTDN